MPKKAVRDRFATVDWIVAIGMGIVAIIFFSLERAMLVGYFGYIVHIVLWKKQKPSVYLVVSFLLLIVGFGVRFFGSFG